MKLCDFYVLIQMIDIFIDHKIKYPNTKIFTPDVVYTFKQTYQHRDCCNDTVTMALDDLKYAIYRERMFML